MFAAIARKHRIAKHPRDTRHPAIRETLQGDCPDPWRAGPGGQVAGARYFFKIPAPTVYFGSTKLPSRTFPHWLSIM
jgi:hypothetical protein